MPTEEQVTIHINDDGLPNLDKFVDHPALSKTKQLIDALRGSNAQLKERAAKFDGVDLDELQTKATKVDKLTKQLDDIKEKAKMTDEERKELETLRQYAELGDLDEVKAKLEQYPELSQRVQENERREAVGKASGDKYNSKALSEILKLRNAELESVKEGDETVWKVKQGEDSVPLSDFVTSVESDLGITLQTAPQRPTIGGASNPGDKPEPDFRNASQEDFNAQLKRLGLQPTRY